MMLKKLLKYIFQPSFRFSINASRGRYNRLSDEDFIKLKWHIIMGGELCLDNPKTLCEKLQWLKLYYRKPELTKMVDKYEAKLLVKDLVGTPHIIPTIGVWDNVNEINIDDLPNQFVLKVTHDSGSIVVCDNKQTFDFDKAKKSLISHLRRNYFLKEREWPYKNVKPRIIAEPLIKELGKRDSVEYKITCFNGKVEFITICTGIAHSSFDVRNNDHYDREFRKLDWYVNYKPSTPSPSKPKEWEQLISFAEKICGVHPYVRVDCYVINGTIVFGEFTFFTWAGFMKFKPKEWDLILGQKLILPKSKL